MTNPDAPHAYKPRTITNERCPDLSVPLTRCDNDRPCDTCGGSDKLAVHMTRPRSRNPFPLFAGTPYARRG